MNQIKSKKIGDTACLKCREKGQDRKGNNLNIFDDGHARCFACDYFVAQYTNDTEYLLKDSANATRLQESIQQANTQVIGNFKEAPERKISEAICEKLGIMTGTYGGKECWAYLHDNGCKIRFKDNKKFLWIEGDSSKCSMFGLAQCNNYDIPIVITEGEWDTATIHERGYQACTVRSSTEAVNCIRHDLDELLKYKEIWLGFDNDHAGKEALKQVIQSNLLPITKIKVIDWGDKKDANEIWMTLTDNDRWELQAREYVPEGLTLSKNLDIQRLRTFKVETIEIPLPKLSNSFGGFDLGCIYYLLAGSGIGKTTLLTWLGMHIVNKEDVGLGALYYEENELVTPLRFTALRNNTPIGELRRSPELISDEVWKVEEQYLKDKRIAFLNEGADRTSKYLMEYIRYLVQVQKYKLIFVDHISYVIGCSGVSKNGERRDIDELVYNLKGLTKELNCAIVAISHITDPKGTTGWDEGEIPSLYSGRGSRAIAQTADGIIGCARDMRSEGKQALIDIYNLKNRWGGKLGKMDSLLYDNKTGNFKRI